MNKNESVTATAFSCDENELENSMIVPIR